MPAPDVWHGLPSGGLYAVAPCSTATVRLNPEGLRSGDIAGLALLCVMAAAPAPSPFAWLGVSRGSDGFSLVRHVERGGRTVRVPLGDRHVWLRAACDFVRHEVGFSYSDNGRHYAGIGEACPMLAGPDAIEAVWCSPFSRAARGRARGGHADFDSLLLTTQRVPRPNDGT